jgi:hypothetical protein
MSAAVARAEGASKNPVWAELIQLLPVLCLAFPFVVKGEVDLAQAGTGFLIGALVSVPVSAVIVFKRYVLNPILVGTAVWLWLGALAFQLPVALLARVLADYRAFGLFAMAFSVGIVTTWLSAAGYVGCRHGDASWVRAASFRLLALTLLVAAWAFVFRANVRLGGGLPFIVLNVARRAMILRAP